MMRALLVAKDDQVTRACWRALQTSGCAVQIVGDLRAAQAVIEAVVPDIVILDAVSEPNAAVTAAEAIRGTPSSCLLLAVAAADAPTLACELRDAGVDVVIDASDDGSELLDRTRRALSHALERGDTMLVNALEVRETSTPTPAAGTNGLRRKSDCGAMTAAERLRCEATLLGLALHLGAADERDLPAAMAAAIASFCSTFELGLMLVFRTGDAPYGLTPWQGWHLGQELGVGATEAIAARLDVVPSLAESVRAEGPLFAALPAALPEGSELMQSALPSLQLGPVAALSLLANQQRQGLLFAAKAAGSPTFTEGDMRALELITEVLGGAARRLDLQAARATARLPEVDAAHTRLRALAALGREVGQITSVLDGHLRVLDDAVGGDLRRDVAAMAQATDRVRHLSEQMQSFSEAASDRVIELHLNDFVVDLEPLARAVLGPGTPVSAVCDASHPWGRVDPQRLRALIAEVLVESSTQRLPGSVVLRSRDAAQVGAVAVEVVLQGGELPIEAMRRLASSARACGLVLRAEAREGDGQVVSLLVQSVKRRRREATTSPFKRTVRHRASAVLVVEDEPMQRRMVVRVLTRLGLRVAEAASAEEALEIVTRQPETWELLVTDICLPHASGTSLARELLRRNENLQTLFMSGYADVTSVERDLGVAVNFLQKPFRQQDLSDRVSELLAAVA